MEALPPHHHCGHRKERPLNDIGVAEEIARTGSLQLPDRSGQTSTNDEDEASRQGKDAQPAAHRLRYASTPTDSAYDRGAPVTA